MTIAENKEWWWQTGAWKAPAARSYDILNCPACVRYSHELAKVPPGDDGMKKAIASRTDLFQWLNETAYAVACRQAVPPAVAAVIAEEIQRRGRAELGGQHIYVGNTDRAELSARNREIAGLFNGRNATDLALRYHLSVAHVRRIVAAARRPAKTK